MTASILAGGSLILDPPESVPQWMAVLAKPVVWLEDHGPAGRSDSHRRARLDRDQAVYDAIEKHGASWGDVAAVLGHKNPRTHYRRARNRLIRSSQIASP